MRYYLIVVFVSIGVSACGSDGIRPIEPYPPLKASAYACSTYKHAASCPSLAARQEYLDHLANMDIEQVSEVRCTLTDRSTGETRGIECGVLLFGAVKAMRPEDLERVRILTDGKIARFPRDGYDFGVLIVPPGTEISAIGKIIFNPELRYVIFHGTDLPVFTP